MSESSFFFVGCKKRAQNISGRQGSCQSCLGPGSVSRAQPHEAGYPADLSLQGFGPIICWPLGLTLLTLGGGSSLSLFPSLHGHVESKALRRYSPSFFLFFVWPCSAACGILVP